LKLVITFSFFFINQSYAYGTRESLYKFTGKVAVETMTGTIYDDQVKMFSQSEHFKYVLKITVLLVIKM